MSDHESWLKDFETFKEDIPWLDAEELVATWNDLKARQKKLDQELDDYINQERYQAEQKGIEILISLEGQLDNYWKALEEVTEEIPVTEDAMRQQQHLLELLRKGAKGLLSRLGEQAMAPDTQKKIKQLHLLLNSSTKEDIAQKVYWDHYYKDQDSPIDPEDWQFEPIDLGDNLIPARYEYILKLYNRTLPVPSVIFKRDPCLVWCGAKDDDGYSKHNPPDAIKGSSLVHRYIYKSVFGTHTEDEKAEVNATIDHACGVIDCINLRHLRLLDRATNKAYGDPRELPHNKT